MATIIIQSGNIKMEAELIHNETGNAILSALPIKGNVNTWGDEIYFTIPVMVDQAGDASADLEPGDLAFWPPGNAFCIFFGPTPMSSGSQPRAASPVNVFGRIKGDLSVLKKMKTGDAIQITKIQA